MIFLLELEMSGVAVQSIHQNSKNDFEAVLVTFCCYGHGAKASQEILKLYIPSAKVTYQSTNLAKFHLSSRKSEILQCSGLLV